MVDFIVILEIFLIGCFGAFLSKVIEFKRILKIIKIREVLKNKIEMLGIEIGSTRKDIIALQEEQKGLKFRMISAIANIKTDEDQKQCAQFIEENAQKLEDYQNKIDTLRAEKGTILSQISGTDRWYITQWKGMAVASGLIGGGFAVFIAVLTLGFTIEIENSGNLANFFIYGAFWDQIFYRLFGEKSTILVGEKVSEIQKTIPLSSEV